MDSKQKPAIPVGSRNNPAIPGSPKNKPEIPEGLQIAPALLEPLTESLSAEAEIEPEVGGPTLPVGMKIDDRYEIMGVIGVGGFATVYRAHHLTIDRDVALKVMDIKKGVDASYSQRFFREAKIAAKIHHNNVVSIYDFGHISETKQPYIAMEMLHGHDLSHELSKNGPLSPQRAFVLFRPVLDALGQGHRLGIVHKDLKPENLYLVDPGGQHELMKVLDFGVARVNSSEMAKLTSAGQLLGTPRYLAPEYIKSQEVSPAIDVYQMALIISEALTGTPAVSGDPFHAMMVHCSGQIQFSEFLLEGRVGEVFRKAISIDPAERYSDCDAFGQALDAIADCFSSTIPLEGGAPQLTPDSRNSSISQMPMNFGSMSSNGDLSRVQADPEPKKKNTALIAIILLLLVGIIGVVLFFLVSQKEQNPESLAPVVQVVEKEKEDVTLEFTFTSDPPGAQVARGKHPICGPTPCKASFKESELTLSQEIDFKLSGYEVGEFELKSTTYDDNHGEVHVKLEKIKEDVRKLDFMLTYTPVHAKVIDVDSSKTLCDKSPCMIVLDLDIGYVDLKVQLDGYVSQRFKINKAVYNELAGAKEVKLEKEKEKPKKASKPATPSSAPATPKPAPQPKKPTLELL